MSAAGIGSGTLVGFTSWARPDSSCSVGPVLTYVQCGHFPLGVRWNRSAALHLLPSLAQLLVQNLLAHYRACVLSFHSPSAFKAFKAFKLICGRMHSACCKPVRHADGIAGGLASADRRVLQRAGTILPLSTHGCWPLRKRAY